MPTLPIDPRRKFHFLTRFQEKLYTRTPGVKPRMCTEYPMRFWCGIPLGMGHVWVSAASQHRRRFKNCPRRRNFLRHLTASVAFSYPFALYRIVGYPAASVSASIRSRLSTLSGQFTPSSLRSIHSQVPQASGASGQFA